MKIVMRLLEPPVEAMLALVVRVRIQVRKCWDYCPGHSYSLSSAKGRHFHRLDNLCVVRLEQSDFSIPIIKSLAGLGRSSSLQYRISFDELRSTVSAGAVVTERISERIGARRPVWMNIGLIKEHLRKTSKF